ncbi:RZZ complex subunit KNTC1/ROD C-terminal, partial [Trinorchestia longiramus]
MDKSALTEQLWRDHRHSPTALLLIADICLKYKVLKASLWNAVLQQLAVCEEEDSVEESSMSSLLLRLRLHPQLWLLQGFVAAWTALVSQPFKKVSPPLSPAAVARCTTAASLLSLCPVVLPSVRELVSAAVQLQLFAVAICMTAALPDSRHLMQ